MLALAQDLRNELTHEAVVIRAYLQIVPFEQKAFQPHPKSETLGRLAIHLAEIMAWWKECLKHDALDFMGFEPKEISTTEELLAYFDNLLLQAQQALREAQEGDFEKEWSMKHGETIYFTLPRKQVLRIFCMNHLVHHRAQLGVYLRLLNIPIPAVYGPSADDEKVILIEKF